MARLARRHRYQQRRPVLGRRATARLPSPRPPPTHIHAQHTRPLRPHLHPDTHASPLSLPLTDETVTTLNFAEQLKMIDVCALGPLRVSSAAYNQGKIAEGGRVIVITSQA